MVVKFIYSEKATKFCEISSLILTTVDTVKSKVEILQNLVAFSEYMNFIKDIYLHFLNSGILERNPVLFYLNNENFGIPTSFN